VLRSGLSPIPTLGSLRVHCVSSPDLVLLREVLDQLGLLGRSRISPPRQQRGSVRAV